MKIIFSALLVLVSFSAFAQSKIKFEYSEFTELEGTEYVIASTETYSKLKPDNFSMLFINTETGEKNLIEFPEDSYIRIIEQIQIEAFDINKVLLMGRTINLNKDKSIDWEDPVQIYICSPNGKDLKQITDDHFFVNTWAINNKTATLIISGTYDSNGNQKKDKGDEKKILLFDLETLTLKMKI